ncbi:MAG: ABC transporter substrate-binding protein, partial [Chloroflexia bacterium]|nr:ABC transporter substrate-binding protein [Chloroflexia bacterium]
MTISRRDALRGFAALSAVALAGTRRLPASAQENPATVRVDYAYYNPSSLVLKKFG